MVTLIYPITRRQSLESLKRSLANLEPDWKLGVDLLCVVKWKNLYTEVRDYLQANVDRGEVLTVYEPDGDPLKRAKEYIGSKNKYVYLSGEVVIPYNALGKLYRNYIENPNLGFVTGISTDYPLAYWVEDIYGWSKFIRSNEKNLEGDTIEIDISSPYGMLTKTDLYKELFCMSDLDEYSGYSYGIRLRRQGYKNLLDMRVEYGGKK